MGCWKENDNYIPKIGDACLYDWQDNGVGDNKGTPKHVGMVTYVNKKRRILCCNGGNYKDAVKKRTVSINGRFIRGFITPKYDAGQPKINTSANRHAGKDVKTVAREVIAGQWGEDYKSNLKEKHYNVDAVMKEVDAVINTPCGLTTTTCSAAYTSNIYKNSYKTSKKVPMRIDAGWNKKLMIEIPAGRRLNAMDISISIKNQYGCFVLQLLKERSIRGL